MSEDPSRPADPPSAADPSRAAGPSGIAHPSGAADSSPGADPSAAGQGPRPGPGQGDTPWQRGDGPAGRAPAPDPDSLWVTGGVLFAGVLMLCQGVVAAYRDPGRPPGDALRRP
ncbi:hypothetical protein [Streptomyces rubiginosohelvolus]|uniref:hypothetical protein n=1 Tax=Streptomyces rubiginosohelvolus TaxID=67362 RepID=UPI0033A1ABD6